MTHVQKTTRVIYIKTMLSPALKPLISMINLIMIFVFFSLKIDGQYLVNVECITKQSGFSGSGHTTTSISCDSGYTLVGCTGYTRWVHLDGSYTIDNTCYAQNDGGVGVWAYARCCTNISLKSYQDLSSNISSAETGAAVSVSCPQNYVLTSCESYSPDASMYGAYPGAAGVNVSSIETATSLASTSNMCTAENNKDSGGTYAKAKCIEPSDDYSLECYTIWGSESGDGDDDISSVCSIYKPQLYIDGAYLRETKINFQRLYKDCTRI